MVGSTEQADLSAARPEGEAAPAVSILDQTLWRRFAESSDIRDYATPWLGLQCRQIDPSARGVLVLGDPEIEDYRPAAAWPEAESLTRPLMDAAERALSSRRGVAGQAGAGGRAALGYPVILDGELHGAVAVEAPGADEAERRRLLRVLQWGVGNLLAALRREQGREREAGAERTELVLDLVAEALEQEGFRRAADAVAAELALRLDCTLAAVGVRSRGRNRVVAVSNSMQFARQMNLVRAIGRAMDEAVDQQAVVMHPLPPDWDFRIAREHEELSAGYGDLRLLTVPLHAHGRFTGALHLERPADRPFDEGDVRLADCAAAALGPILEDRRREDRTILAKIAGTLGAQTRRLVGPRHYGRKIASLAVLGVTVFLATATGQYRVTSPATLHGTVERAVVAPMDGYIGAATIRAGAVVEEGEVMARMDSRDLEIERLRWQTEHAAKSTAYDRALAEHERSEANVLRSEISQAEAQIELLDLQIARAALVAPFDGLVISGDLSQHVGGAVKRGDELFRISPLDSWRLHLEVDERDIAEIQPGQEGALVASSMPEDAHAYVVRRITPFSESRDGRTWFRVEAELLEPSLRLAPGMSGVAKTEVEERLLIAIWTDRLADWARVFFWKWLP